ncbi:MULTISPECIES: carbohydrate ABC transporter permease [Mesobacillus]|uniref:ABC transporter permease n=2 Tax=Mesobacillus TaxID=2675231 RepID=A0A0D6ZFK8_9BACI|nr:MULTISPECIES: sugar ABC transporter permease [Mesobacillus]KIY23861.1 ABC transporter permease [Mesobacillus subterraneus]MDQ0415484.1 N-acetylglucosamine transport system permease protein [Mesobacillus stamsii]
MVLSKKQKYVFLTFCLLPTFIVFCIFTVYPMIGGLYYSFFDWSGTSSVKEFIGLGNYQKLLSDSVIPKAIVNDYIFVFVKVFGIMILALFFAVALTQLRLKEAPFYRIVFFFPNIMSVVVIGILWQFIYDPNIGIVNGILRTMGLEEWTRPWLGDMTWALPSIAVPAIWAGIGLFMLLLMGGITDIPKNLYEAAEIDGASEWQQFWRITVPLIWPQIKTSIIYIVITSLNGSFVLVQVMTAGGPGIATEVLGSYLYQKAFEDFKFGYGAAIGVLILVASLLTVIVLQFLLKKEKVEY